MNVVSPNKVVFDGELDLRLALDGDCELSVPLDGELGIITVVHEYDQEVYTGATEVTPSLQPQTLYTGDKIVLDDIIINPIPSNYGLITWNGSTLTVS